MSEYTNADCRRMVKAALADLPQPYAIGTTAVLMEVLPLTSKQVYIGFGALIHHPSYDRLVIRSEVSFGLDGMTQIIDEERRIYHQERIDKAKLKARNIRENERLRKQAQELRKQESKVIPPPPVQEPLREAPAKSQPVIRVKKRRTLRLPERGVQ